MLVSALRCVLISVNLASVLLWSKTVKKHLVSKREMLQEYFSICITEDGHLSAIPILIKGYIPNLEKLPDFLWRLGSEVNELVLKNQIPKPVLAYVYCWWAVPALQDFIFD
jgi:hypothetical protein